MTIKFKGYCKNAEDIPVSILPKNAVQFNEPDDFAKLNWSSLLFIPIVFSFMWCMVSLRQHLIGAHLPFRSLNIWGVFLSILFIVPHEILHAIGFSGGSEVSIYITWFSAFCYSPSVISKKRFIFMSALPAVILGVLPFLIWVITPMSYQGAETLYTFASLNLLCCVGDFLNIFNAITQMPSGTYQQMSGIHSYWFYLTQE